MVLAHLAIFAWIRGFGIGLKSVSTRSWTVA